MFSCFPLKTKFYLSFETGNHAKVYIYDVWSKGRNGLRVSGAKPFFK